MLLRNSISSTRKFFQRTLGSLKSLFSGSSYQKLPKSPPNKPFSGSTTTAGVDTNCSIQKMSCKLGDFADQMSCKHSTNKADHKVKITSQLTTKQDHTDHRDCHSSTTTKTNSAKSKKLIEIKSDSEMAKTEGCENKVVIVKRKEDRYSSAHNREEHSRDEGMIKNYVLVEQKLKELEMLDMSNVDHVLDIEEVLHYYSRLTCPAYLEIVDKFFVEIFAEFFGSSTPVCNINSGLRLNLAKI